MRRFFSYGPLDKDLHYFVPRTELIDDIYSRLIGEDPQKNGHYITVWGPRQTGKTWLMQQVLARLQADERFDVLKINLESLKYETDAIKIAGKIAEKISGMLKIELPLVTDQDQFQGIFKNGILNRPVILILDEFDALPEVAIGFLVSAFRNIYNTRLDEMNLLSGEKAFLLHGVALIGIRGALGIENVKGSPFNVQKSLHIPNLTLAEVEGLFEWFSRESGQKVETDVVAKLYRETSGQPGLTCWFGELLTEAYNNNSERPISMDVFHESYAAAIHTIPNNNILNIISKVKHPPYRQWILKLFKTDDKITFHFDDPQINYLYLNGVIEAEKVGSTDYFVKFSSSFVQTRLFNYFSGELFDDMGQLVEPFENLDNVLTPDGVDIRNLLGCYRKYLLKNKEWLLKDAPRRKDLRIFEAVYHFNLYMYLVEFFKSRGGKVYPEFPTGNGKIDLIIRYQGKTYGLELKSFSHEAALENALEQAARYAVQLGLQQIAIAFFVEAIDDARRQAFEADIQDSETGITISPIFIEMGG